MSQSNLAEKIDHNANLTDLVLDDAKKQELDLVDHELFEIELAGEIVGPVWFKDLQTFLYQHEELYAVAQVKRITEETWERLGSHPLFQRRTPRVVPPTEEKYKSEQNHYYLSENGQQLGPITREEISSMLAEHTLLYSDLISYDEGYTWVKVYEIEGLDRRTTKEQLPPSPAGEFIHRSHLEALEGLSEDSEKHMEKEAMTGLVFIGQMKSGKTIQNRYISTSKEHTSLNVQPAPEPMTPPSKTLKTKGLIAAAIGVVLIIGMILTQLSTDSDTLETTETPMKVKQATVLDPAGAPVPSDQARIEKIKKRNSSRAARRVVPRRSQSRSFKNTKAYQNDRHEMMDDAAMPPEEPYYDDATDPVELDPVRSRLGRNTVAGEEPAMYDDDREGNRAPATDPDNPFAEIRSKEEFEGEGPAAEEGLFDEEIRY